MNSSDEDLPDVVLKSPRKKRNKNDFTMPDASVIAAQRKIEDEKDSLINSRIEQSFNDISSYTTTMETSHFVLPDADKIAAERLMEVEKDKIIAEIMSDKTLSNSDPELHSCIDVIQSNDGLISIPGENPGVDMTLLNYEKLTGIVCKETIDFIKSFFLDIHNGNNSEKEKLITNVLNIFNEIYSIKGSIISLNDFICHFMTVCGLILDKECRKILTIFSTSNIVCNILNRIPTPQTDQNLLEILSDLILSCFSNFHDRLHLSEHFIIKFNPLEINNNPKYFSTRLGKSVLHKTLCSLVQFTKDSPSTCNSFDDLRKIIYYGEKTKTLTPYEQYILLKISNELHWMLIVSDEEISKQNKAKSWIINFFSGLKCSNVQNQKSADFFKVKNLSSKLKLLWQMDSED